MNYVVEQYYYQEINLDKSNYVLKDQEVNKHLKFYILGNLSAMLTVFMQYMHKIVLNSKLFITRSKTMLKLENKA